MIAIIDYGVGNIFSLQSSLAHLGIESIVTSDRELLQKADQLILPGVGAFGDAIARLHELGLEEILKDLVAQGKPLLGICLGMQLLFEESEEFGRHQGLGFLKGKIQSLTTALGTSSSLKVPHIGWNELQINRNSPLLREISSGDRVYYVHSYFATDCEDSLIATSEYGVLVPGFVQKNNVYGAQFHPEKSGAVGLRLLRAFSEVKG